MRESEIGNESSTRPTQIRGSFLGGFCPGEQTQNPVQLLSLVPRAANELVAKRHLFWDLHSETTAARIR